MKIVFSLLWVMYAVLARPSDDQHDLATCGVHFEEFNLHAVLLGEKAFDTL